MRRVLKLKSWSNNPCKFLILKDLRPLGSVVEHSLHTRGVSSSNLLAGTNIFNNLRATASRRELQRAPVTLWAAKRVPVSSKKAPLSSKEKPAYPNRCAGFIWRPFSKPMAQRVMLAFVLRSSFFSFVSFATALVIILGWLFFLFRLNHDFRRVLGWTLLVVSSPLGESASAKEAGHRDR